MIVFPNCKINLGLHVLQKRADGYHELETFFYPLPLRDALEIVQEPVGQSSLTTTGIKIDAQDENNICFKAWKLMKQDFPQLPAVKIHLHKTIPSGAGLGGGSADGAFTLLLLDKKFRLQCSRQQLLKSALQLGSDCPFFIRNKPCYATGRGELLEEMELDLSAFKIILVNPGIHIATGQVFSKIHPSEKSLSIREIIQKPITEWKKFLKNDLEAIVFDDHPEIKIIRDRLYQEGAVYAAMSGSGSSVYGLFRKDAAPEFSFPTHYFIRHI